MAAKKGRAPKSSAGPDPAPESSGTPPVEAGPKPSHPIEGEVLPPPKRARKPKKAAEAPAAEPADGAEEPEEKADGEPAEPALDELIDGEAATEAEVPETELTALVPATLEKAGPHRDVLSAYMHEVSQHPLLTREEEVALARQFRDTQDVKAEYRLVAANLRLVVKLAHEYHRNPLSLLDLVQEGNIGLMQAVKKFDPERGVKLSSYAAWWIRAYILRYIMDNWKMVKLGTTEAQRKLFFKLRQEQDRLSAQGYEVTPKLLAERLNVTEQDVIDMDRRLGQDELSLDAPLGHEEDGPTRADRLLTTGATGADDQLGSAQLKALFKAKLDEFAKTLNEKEKLLFEKRLVADEPLTLQEIGAQWGVSRERARQIEATLVERMRTFMRAHIPDFDLVKSDED